MIRIFVANLIAPRMARTGFRFSKAFRHGETLGHRIVYALVSTVHANMQADMIEHDAWVKAWRDHHAER
jgi:hypothetical protein